LRGRPHGRGPQAGHRVPRHRPDLLPHPVTQDVLPGVRGPRARPLTMPALRSLLHGAAELLYPSRCLLCHEPRGPEHAPSRAPRPRDLLTDPWPSCPRCAATVGPFATPDGRCVHCRHEALPFEAAVRLGAYDGRLRDAVLRMKHRTGEGLAEELGRLWGREQAQRLAALGAHVVVPVPLHWWRRWRRGYNQAAALAFGLGQALGLPCRRWCLRRVRATPPQTSQSGPARRANVQGAFQARRGVRLGGQTVLLVDDVMTTG